MSDLGTRQVAKASRGIALCLEPPSRETRSSSRPVLDGREEDAGDHLQGVAPVLDDVEAGVAALEPLDRDLHRHRAHGGPPPLHRQGGDGVGPSRAAEVDRPVLLGVEVQHHPAGDDGRVEGLGPGEAGLLVDGAEDLQRAVDHVGVVGDGEGGGDADPVVGPQGRPLRLHPVAVHVDVDGVLHEVEVHVGVLLAHHVQVPLDDDGGRGLVPRGGRNLDHQVAGGVLEDLVALLLRPALDVGGDRCFVPGRARDPPDAVEMRPEEPGLQALEGAAAHRGTP